jgi:pilus assembly protein CpaB
MRFVFGLVLLTGIGLAGLAAYMVNDYVAQQNRALAVARAAQTPAVPMVEVVVANRPLRFGEPLRREDVRTINWPRSAVPEGAFTDLATLFPEGETRQRVVLRAMERFEPVMLVKVSAPGQDAGITSRLTRGMRAFTIRVDVTTGVSGFLRPGDAVDVYWTGQVGNRQDFTRLIQAGLRLIAVDQSADQDRGLQPVIARNLTVEVSPQQAAALAQAQSTGRLSLALVGAMDDTLSEIVEMDQRTLLGLEIEVPVVEAPAAAPEETCHIRTRRGAEVVMIQIPCTN